MNASCSKIETKRNFDIIFQKLEEETNANYVLNYEFLDDKAEACIQDAINLIQQVALEEQAVYSTFTRA